MNSRSPSRRECKLLTCSKPVHYDNSTGIEYEFCSRSHGKLFDEQLMRLKQAHHSRAPPPAASERDERSTAVMHHHPERLPNSADQRHQHQLISWNIPETRIFGANRAWSLPSMRSTPRKSRSPAADAATSADHSPPPSPRQAARMPHLDPTSQSMRVTDAMVLFWEPPCVFTQWEPVDFKVENVKYCSAEQYMMASKAAFFDDHVARRNIMAITDPARQKHLGRGVANFDPVAWDAVKLQFVLNGNYHKFTQNPEMCDELLATGHKIIAEASPEDKVWGIGMAAFNPNVENTERWRGQNLLGKALMYVRSKILFERPDLAARPRVQSVATAVATANNLARPNPRMVSSPARSRTSPPSVYLSGVPDTTAARALQEKLSSDGNSACTLLTSPSQGGAGISATRFEHAPPRSTSGAATREIVNGVDLSWYYALSRK